MLIIIGKVTENKSGQTEVFTKGIGRTIYATIGAGALPRKATYLTVRGLKGTPRDKASTWIKTEPGSLGIGRKISSMVMEKRRGMTILRTMASLPLVVSTEQVASSGLMDLFTSATSIMAKWKDQA